MKVRFTFVGMLGLMLSANVWAQKPQTSAGDEAVWYYVTSASTGASAGMVMSDNQEASATYPIALQAQSTSQSQQWKLQEDGSGLLRLVNRATGRIIQPASEAATLYNITQLQSAVIEGRGFTLKDLGNGQYALSGVEGDGVTRHLISAQEEVAPTATEAVAGSVFAWTFQDASTVGINGATADAAPAVSVVDGKITVLPAVPYEVYGTDGVSVPTGAALSAGVYIVRAAGKTVKVIVNK